MKILGSIAWYSVTGSVDRSGGRRRVLPVRVNHDMLERWFEECELDTSFVPSMVKRIDAWRTATGKRVRWEYTRQEKVPNESDDEFDDDTEEERPATYVSQSAVLTVREVEVKPDFVTRHVIRSIDGDGTDHVATLKFIRGGRTARGKRHSGDHWQHSIINRGTSADRADIKAFIDHIDDVYKNLSVNLHETKIRSILRDYLVQKLQALPVRAGGGVYFVHREYQDELARLQTVVRKMGGDCRLEQHPLVDSENARQMVADALEAKVEDAVRLFIDDVVELVENSQRRRQKIPAEKYAEKQAEFVAIVDRCDRYADVIGGDVRAHQALDMGREALESLKHQTGGGR